MSRRGRQNPVIQMTSGSMRDLRPDPDDVEWMMPLLPNLREVLARENRFAVVVSDVMFTMVGNRHLVWDGGWHRLETQGAHPITAPLFHLSFNPTRYEIRVPSSRDWPMCASRDVAIDMAIEGRLAELAALCEDETKRMAPIAIAVFNHIAADRRRAGRKRVARNRRRD